MKTTDTEYAKGFQLGSERFDPVAGCPPAFIDSLYNNLIVRAQRDKHLPDPIEASYWQGFVDGFNQAEKQA